MGIPHVFYSSGAKFFLNGSLTMSGDIFVCTIWGQEVATEISPVSR